MKRVDAAWAAGFIDGEGHFYARQSREKGQPGKLVVGVVASQVSLAPLERLQELFGGGIRTKTVANPRWRPQWRWEVRGGSGVIPVVDALERYMLVKRGEALLVRALAETMVNHTGRKLAPEVEQQREELLRELRELRV